MGHVESRLRRLTHVFIAWFVVQSILGTWVALRVLEDLRETSLADALESASPDLVVGSAVLAAIALLALGIWLFHCVTRLRPTARIVLLALAWISAVSALVGLLIAPARAPGSAVPSVVGILANVLSLAFWAWTIRVLQFDAQVRNAFPAATS
jgi:hypothetical protein